MPTLSGQFDSNNYYANASQGEWSPNNPSNFNINSKSAPNTPFNFGTGAGKAIASGADTASGYRGATQMYRGMLGGYDANSGKGNMASSVAQLNDGVSHGLKRGGDRTSNMFTAKPKN